MLKNLFSVVVWGEKYSSYLCDISIPTLLTSYNLALLKPNTGNTFLIVTTSRDQNIIEKHESIKNLKKLLDVKFEIIKKPHQSFFENKYKVLSILQSKILQFSSDFDFVHFLYPDFVYSNGTFNSIFEQFKNNVSAIGVPIPRINTEHYINETQSLTISDLNARFLKFNFEKFCLPMFTPGQKSFFCDENTTSIFPSTLMWKIKTNTNEGKYLYNILFKCFHLHPISLKVQHDNPRMNADFSISFDEEFVSNLFPDIGTFYIPEKSGEIAICSLDDNHPATVDKNEHLTVLRISRFAERFASVLHRSFVEKNYIWEVGLSNPESEKVVKKEAKNLIDKVLMRLQIPSTVLKQTDIYSYNQRKKREKVYRKSFFTKRGLPPIFYTFSKKRLFLVLIFCQLFFILHITKVLKIFPFLQQPGNFLGWYRHLGLLYTTDEYAAVKIRMFDFYLYWLKLLYIKVKLQVILAPFFWFISNLLVHFPNKLLFLLKAVLRNQNSFFHLRSNLYFLISPLIFILLVIISIVIYVYMKNLK